MINDSYYLIAFDSTHSAMAAEAFFKERQTAAKLIPLPGVISAGCGFAIKIAPADKEDVLSLLKHSTFDGANFYKITKENGEIVADSWVI